MSYLGHSLCKTHRATQPTQAHRKLLSKPGILSAHIWCQASQGAKAVLGGSPCLLPGVGGGGLIVQSRGKGMGVAL